MCHENNSVRPISNFL